MRRPRRVVAREQCGDESENARAGQPDGPRTQVERGNVQSRRNRQRGLHAGQRIRRQASKRYQLPTGEWTALLEEALLFVRVGFPQECGDIFQRGALRQREDVVTAVKEPAIVNERDAGFENRATPMKPARGGLRRVAPRLLAFPQPVDIFAVIAPLLRPAWSRFRSQLAAARIRIQRCARDAERGRRLRSREVIGVVWHNTLIIESILTM